MNAVYSTRGVDGDRRRTWEAFICQLYASLDMQVRGTPAFEGVVTECPLDDLDLTRAIADYEIASRKRHHIARDVRQSCVFLFIKRGPLTLEQFGREALLDSNTCSMVDLAAPYVLKHATVSDTYFVKAPEVLIRSRFKDIHSHCAIARPIGHGISRVAADLIASLTENASAADERGASYLAAQILDILAMVFDAAPDDMPEGSSLARAAVRKRALAYIDHWVGDPTLDPARVAAAVGVSTRYLHKVFESSERSLSAHIRTTRLWRAREDLADQRLCQQPISAIASRNGFLNQSCFATAFKKEFGASPRSVRAASRS